MQSLTTKVNQTKQLLDRYVAILGQAEHNARLLLDPNWQGAEAVRTCMLIFTPINQYIPPRPPTQDAARLAEIRRREEESIRLEREAAQQKEEEERARREAEERSEAEKVHTAAVRIRGGVRGSARARGGATMCSLAVDLFLTWIAFAASLPTAGRGSRVSAPGATRTPSAPRPLSSTAMRAPSSGGNSTGSAGKTRGSFQPSSIKPPAAGRGIPRGIGRGKPTGT